MPAEEDLSNILVQTLEQAIDSVVVINSSNNIILYNSAAERFWGFTREEVMGKNVKILVPDHLKPNHDNLINANRETGVNKIVGTNREVEVVCKDGSVKWGALSISKVNVHDKILYTAFVKDVTSLVLQRRREEMLSLVTDKTDNAIIITDHNWKTIYLNKGLENILGFDEGDLIGRYPIPLLAPHFTEEAIEATREGLKKGSPLNTEELISTKNGRRLWCSIVSNPVYDESNQLKYVVTILSEITTSKLHEVIQAKVLGAIAEEKSLEVIMDLACNEVSKIDKDILSAIYLVDSKQQLQLLSAPEISSELYQSLNKVKINTQATPSAMAAFKKAPVLITDLDKDQNWSKFKGILHLSCIRSCESTPILNKENDCVGVITFSWKQPHIPTEIDKLLVSVLSPLCSLSIEREKNRQKIRQLAFYDELTKLPNRSLLQVESEQALREAKDLDTNLAVLFVDFDRFKQINDSFGHPSGDYFLQVVAERMRLKCLNKGICGRLSGDEFVIILTNTPLHELNNFIEDLKLSISLPVNIKRKNISPSVSIGVSVFPDDGEDISTLIHRADIAMYQAKSAGRGRFTFFSQKLNELAQERQLMEIELENALKNNELELVYQPQINMDDGSLHGVEALARWQHIEFGNVSPAKFIPMAEDCGLIGDLSKWVLKTACKQMSLWKENGVPIPKISVNVSPANFNDDWLSYFIKNELLLHNLEASEIVFEITEGMIFNGAASTMKIMNDINIQGIGFAIDDFGTGYSGLSYLNKLPIEELKLDKSFVTDITRSKTGRALSKAILQIGESLGLDVVAEGIETKEQFQILKDQGYHVAQGFYFSKPLSAQDLNEWTIISKQFCKGDEICSSS
ncbi:MAG: EAL domain-containing protein [Marinomonas sp.]